MSKGQFNHKDYLGKEETDQIKKLTEKIIYLENKIKSISTQLKIYNNRNNQKLILLENRIEELEKERR